MDIGYTVNMIQFRGYRIYCEYDDKIVLAASCANERTGLN